MAAVHGHALKAVAVVRTGLGARAVVAALAHLLFGPRPRRGTRWFWFWVLGVTGGVGAAAYALYEIGGRRADRAPLEEDRPGGWAGFGWLLFLTMAVGILAQLTLALVGATVTPL